VQRDPPARRRDHLRDPAAHLARADYEDVLEPHESSFARSANTIAYST
jgi:hypothetical protein